MFYMRSTLKNQFTCATRVTQLIPINVCIDLLISVYINRLGKPAFIGHDYPYTRLRNL